MEFEKSLDLQRLEREIMVARKEYVKGNKSIAREIAKWADKAMDEGAGDDAAKIG
jgi:hypothetical protein